MALYYAEFMFTCFNTDKKSYLIWALLLSLAIICAHGVKLHVHNMDHTHRAVESLTKHSHDSVFHLSLDTSHAEHHHAVISEIDLGINALLKDISGTVITLALLVTLIVLPLYHLFLLIFCQHRGHPDSIPWRYCLGPPLRAPPL